ncbi:MAG TPA: hypothetical protein VMH50_02715 [Thermoleophilia bacterium]|nr:hypothetical protein [Thermoleophilia bacterium]
MTGTRRRTCPTIALVAALVIAAAAAAACSAHASGGAVAGSGGAATSSSAPAGSAAGSGKAGADDDWSRIAGALAWMQAVAPTKPVVALLGGSAARESTISDQSWREQIVGDGGPATLAWNMGSHNRTMAQNVAIVRALPKGVQAVVFVGINLGSFTSTQKSAVIKLPSPAPTAPPSLEQPHQYGVSTTGILSKGKKQAMVVEWLGKRYPVYKANFSRNAKLLETLIRLCRTRGYKPVLFELPRNTQVIGGSLTAPTARFRAKCQSLAARYHIPWVSLVSAAKVPNPDFYDIWHLVEPGRTIWQKLLSAKTAALLKKYGYDGGA